MAEGCVTDIVSQGYGLDEIQIKAEHRADVPGDSGYQLDMQRPTGDVIVLIEGKDLGFVRVAVVERQMHDFLHIPHKSRPPKGGRIRSAQVTPHHPTVRKLPGILPMLFPILLNSLLQAFTQPVVIQRHR